MLRFYQRDERLPPLRWIGAIGISLYLSQAVSIAFYMIALAEAFDPVLAWVQQDYGWPLDPRAVSLLGTLFLVLLILKKGAAMGARTLWLGCSSFAADAALSFVHPGRNLLP